MALNKDKNLKLYFSISEVAQMFDVNESTLRFWEKEFDQIRPRKTGKGTRSYRQEDIDAIRLVYHLVKERGMTLAAHDGYPAKAEREPGDNDTPRRDRKQVETDQGRIARHEGSIRSVGSFQIALTP